MKTYSYIIERATPWATREPRPFRKFLLLWTGAVLTLVLACLYVYRDLQDAPALKPQAPPASFSPQDDRITGERDGQPILAI